MKVGDLIRVKNPGYLIPGGRNDENRAREFYPWKFEVGIVVDTELPGCVLGETRVYFPGYSEKTILRSVVEVVS